MNDTRVPIREDRDILKLAQKCRSVTQGTIADALGMKRNSLCQNMSRPRMSLGMFAKILDVLDYDVIIVDRTTSEPAWQLHVERAGECDDDV